MDSKKIISMLEQSGWVHIRTTGSHWHFKHAAISGIVTVPHPQKDIPIGTLKSIARQSGLTFK